MPEKKLERTLFLFDVDGTLTRSRQKVTPEVEEFLKDLRTKTLTGFVGGSDFSKQKEQLGDNCASLFTYCFPENGLHYLKNGKEVFTKSYLEEVGEDLHKRLVNFSMDRLSKMDLPIKRGSFIELRESMVNISPVGRSCSREERKEFVEHDRKSRCREALVEELRKEFSEDKLTFSIGGEISIDCFPSGWDKTFCLSHLKDEGIDLIHFFGDKTSPGGNDHEISIDSRVCSHTVSSPEDTMRQVNEILKGLE
jgi:phosphomannomutase